MMSKRKPGEKDISEIANWNLWEKEASEFPWTYSEKETCYILEGRATITASNGETMEISAGDMVEFEKGLECTWHIGEKIVKRYQFG